MVELTGQMTNGWQIWTRNGLWQPS